MKDFFPPKLISSKDNVWIKRIHNLKSKKGRDKYREYWIEGERAVKEVLKEPNLIVAIFIRESLKEKWDLIIPNSCQSCTFYLAGNADKQVGSTETFSGIGAIVHMKKWNTIDIFGEKDFLLYLDHISDPGNLGTIIRTACAFKVGAILLSPCTTDIYNPKVIRSTMGNILKIPVISNITSKELLKIQQCYDYTIVGSTLNEKSVAHYNYDFNKPIVLVIGSEANGMTDEVAMLCDAFVKIPISMQTESLNAAVACGIILSEANRQMNCRR